MCGIRGYPEGLWRGLGIVEGIDHTNRYEGVAITMNEKHGIAALADLTESRSLAERPAIAQATEQAGGMKQGEGRQVEGISELDGKLVPDAGIAAIFDEAQVTDALRHRLARKHHGGGCTHGNAVDDHCVGLKKLHPMEQVEAVEPTHPDSIAVALATGMQFGHDDIVAEEVVVDASQPEKLDCTIAPTVNDNGRSFRMVINVEGMMSFARRHDDKSVAQGMDAAQAVNPLPTLGIGLELLTVARVNIGTIGVGSQREMEHIEPSTREDCHEKHDGQEEYQKGFSHVLMVGEIEGNRGQI